MPYLASESRYDSMTYNRTGNSGLKLPQISLGWWYNFGGRDLLENGRAIAHRAFDLGITHFDLANNYGPPPGSAEENFGTLFKQGFPPYRDELIISTKAGYDMWPGPYGEWGSRKYMLASLDASLKRMGLEYVDIFYSHRPDPETPFEETMGALDSAVRQGKALYVGISSYNPDQTRRAAKSCRSWVLPVSSTNLPTICLIVGSKVDFWMCFSRKGLDASFSRLSRRDSSLTVISRASPPAHAPPKPSASGSRLMMSKPTSPKCKSSTNSRRRVDSPWRRWRLPGSCANRPLHPR